MTAEVVQFAGSLAAILVLAAIAWKLDLGSGARIREEAHVRELADDAVPGFATEQSAIDPAGEAALACDAGGRVVVLRRHGAHFAARLLDRTAHAEADGGAITVDCGDRRFGTVTLDLGPDTAATWAARIERL